MNESNFERSDAVSAFVTLVEWGFQYEIFGELMAKRRGMESIQAR